MKEYRNFVFQNPTKMENIITSYTTFVKENVQSETPENTVQKEGKDIKLFYTVETKRIEIPVGSDTGSKKDDKKATFDKIFRRIKKVSKFIKVPEPTLTPIENKKYFACLHPNDNGFTFDREFVQNKEKPDESKYKVIMYTDINLATKRCEELNRELKKKKGSNDDYDPWKVVSKEVEVYDLKMATVLKPEDEWLILGTIDHKDGLLKAAPGQQVPINLVPNEMVGHSYCDHCHRTIYRNKTVFVQKIKTGEILRVGGSCIRNYLGYDYEKVLSYLTDISFLDESYGDFDGGGWDEDMGWSWGGKMPEDEISTDEVIRYFYWFYKKNGYLSKASAEKINQKKHEESDTETNPEEYREVREVKPTSSLVQRDVDFAHSPPDRRSFRGRDASSDFQRALNEWSDFVEEYNEKCSTITDEEVKWVVDFIHANRDNNFIFNASNMIKSGSVVKRLLYYVTGACSWYFGKLAIEDRKKREAEEALRGGKKESEFIGTIGQKSKLENLEVVHIGGFETMYGWSNVYKLKDQNGNIFTKFGTIGTQYIVKKTEENPLDGTIQVGDVISATAEIKNHDEYKGVKQTTLGRLSKL